MIVSTVDPTANQDYRILPVRPNWSSNYRVSHEFMTDIFTSGDGKEQRRAVRDNPRKQFSFEAVFTGRSKLAFAGFMNHWQPHIAIMPDHSSKLVLNGVAPEAQFAGHLLGAIPEWVKPGMLVVLCDPDRTTLETRTVTNVSAVSVLFAEFSETTTFAPGTTMHPAVFGRIEEEPRSRYLTSNVQTIPIVFDVDPGSEQYVRTGGTGVVGFREFMARKPNWSRPVEMRHIYPRATIDYGIGRIDVATPMNFPSRVTSGSYVGRSYEDVQAVTNFFVRHFGRAREFLMPTWENDLDFYAIAGGGFAIACRGIDLGMFYNGSTVFRRIVLRMADGSYVHRLVDTIEALPDTDTSIVWLTEALPISDLSPTTLHGISWCLNTRFASDKLVVDWLTDGVAQFSMSFQSLENFEL